MSGYIGKSPGASTENRIDFVANAGQTVFIFGYTPGYLDVFINGTIQKIGVDYTATSGTSFTTVLALAAGDEVFATASFANAPINAYTKVENDLVLSTKALLAGSATQAFSATTAAAGTNTTQVATTAYATALGLTKALLAGSAIQGFSATTAAAGTNTTQVATTAYATALGLTKALLAGSATQAFSAAAAIAADHVMRKDQIVGRNVIVNGPYSVSQINADTAHTITAAAAINYGIDMFYTQSTGQNITAQRVAGPAPFRYAYKLLAGATGPTTTLHGTRIEGKDVNYLANGNVAVQVGILCDVARTVTWTAYYATVEDTFSTKTQIATGTLNATTAQATYNFNFNAGANAGLGLCIEYTTGALTNATGYITYSGHQAELVATGATVGTSYEHVGYATQLARCQRNYETLGFGAVGALSLQGYISATTSFIAVWHQFLVTKRGAPTLSIIGTFNAANTGQPIIDAATVSGFRRYNGGVAVGPIISETVNTTSGFVASAQL